MSEPVMYIVVNSNVKMSPGKVAAQAAHVAVKASHGCERTETDIWRKWYGGSYVKIVLKAPEVVLEALIRAYPSRTEFVRDEGRTEVQRNTLTALAFFPMTKDDSEFPKELKDLPLY